MSVLADKFSDIIMRESDSKTLGEIISSLIWFDQICTESAVFKFAITSPTLQQQQRISLIKKCGKASGIAPSDMSVNILLILIKLKKTIIINELASNLRRLSLKKQNITQTEVVFATAPTENQINVVKNILTKIYKINPEMSIKIDASIVAGFVAFFDNKRLDASLHNAFEDLSRLHIE